MERTHTHTHTHTHPHIHYIHTYITCFLPFLSVFAFLPSSFPFFQSIHSSFLSFLQIPICFPSFLFSSFPFNIFFQLISFSLSSFSFLFIPSFLFSLPSIFPSTSYLAHLFLFSFVPKNPFSFICFLLPSFLPCLPPIVYLFSSFPSSFLSFYPLFCLFTYFHSLLVYFFPSILLFSPSFLIIFFHFSLFSFNTF